MQGSVVRNQTVDIAKGIAGILVVLGHTMAFRYDNGVILHLSHLTTPIFIFLAGVFIKVNRQFYDSLIRKIDSLLKPYLTASLLVVLLFAWQGSVDLLYSAVGVLYATGATVMLFAIWFIPHFFVCVLVGVWLIRWLEKPFMPVLVRWLVLLALLVVGQRYLPVVSQQPIDSVWWRTVLRPNAHWPGLPWSLDALPLTLVFLLSGRFLSQSVRNFRSHWLLAALSFVLLVWMASFPYAMIDINSRVYRDVVMTTLFVLAGTYGALVLSEAISKVVVLSKFFSYVGENFLLILCIHVLVLRFVFHQIMHFTAQWQAWYIIPMFLLSIFLLLVLVVLVRRVKCLSMLFFPVMSERKAQ